MVRRAQGRAHPVRVQLRAPQHHVSVPPPRLPVRRRSDQQLLRHLLMNKSLCFLALHADTLQVAGLIPQKQGASLMPGYIRFPNYQPLSAGKEKSRESKSSFFGARKKFNHQGLPKSQSGTACEEHRIRAKNAKMHNAHYITQYSSISGSRGMESRHVSIIPVDLKCKRWIPRVSKGTKLGTLRHTTILFVIAQRNLRSGLKLAMTKMHEHGKKTNKHFCLQTLVLC